ncbi:MAG: glycosyltransferase family 39 protein [Herpetosiphon sp.]
MKNVSTRELVSRIPFRSLLLPVTLLAVYLAFLAVDLQRPWDYTFRIGQEDGRGSDGPWLSAWNDTENLNGLPFRWTARRATLTLPGVPIRPAVLTLNLLGIPAHPQAKRSFVILSFGRAAGTMEVPPVDRRVTLIVPPLRNGLLRLAVDAPVFIETAETARELGIPASRFALESLSTYAAVPAWSLLWPLVVLVASWWVTIWLRLSRTWSAAVLLCLLAIVIAMLMYDLPRFALLGAPLLTSLSWGVVLAFAMYWLGRRFLPFLQRDFSLGGWRWLVVIIALLWTVRYTGRIYPFAMPGDVGFHVNHTTTTINGLLFPVSRHRGIDFPYPSGLYVALLPALLIRPDLTAVVNWMDAFCGLLGVPAVAYLGWRAGRLAYPDDPDRAEPIALCSAAIYAALAPAMMALFWSFLPHIYAQELAVVAVAALVAAWPHLDQRPLPWLLLASICLVFFGHLGLYINLSLLLGACILFQLLLPGDPADRSRARALLVFLVVTQVAVLLLVYSSYAGLIVSKVTAFLHGGMGAVQENRPPVAAGRLLYELWVFGVGAHYAWVGLPLGIAGVFLLIRNRPRHLFAALCRSAVVVAILQALIPFLTHSTITTRWLSFIAWLVALGCAIVIDLLWRRGRLGAALSTLLFVWIAGHTALIWLHAMWYRIRPPEPF